MSQRLGRPKNGLHSHQGDARATSTTSQRCRGDISILQTRWQPICPEVAGTSPRCLRQSLQRLLSLLGLQQVSEKSQRRCGVVSPVAGKISLTATDGDVAETSPRPAGDWKMSPKYWTCLNFLRLPGDPVSLRNQRPAETWVATRSPPSLQANEIGP